MRRAAMVGGADYAVDRHTARRQAEALTKLEHLLDSGVLTEEQYEAEKQKLLRGS